MIGQGFGRGLLLRWRDGAAAMLQMFRPGWPVSGLKDVQITQTPPEDVSAFLGRRRSKLALHLAPHLCLHRRLSLPRAARGEAAKAIDLQTRASLPHHGEGFVWAHRRAGSDPAQDFYDIWVLRAETLDDLLARFRAEGGRPVRVGIAGVSGAFLWEAEPVSRGTLRTWAMATVLAVLLLSLGHVALLELQRQELDAVLQDRIASIAALERRLATQKETRAREGAQANAFQEQIQRFQELSRPLAFLRQLGRDLPEGVWLSELAISPEVQRISGFSQTDATGLVQGLQALAWVRDVRLESPIIQDSYSGQFRFELMLRLNPPMESP